MKPSQQCLVMIHDIQGVIETLEDKWDDAQQDCDQELCDKIVNYIGLLQEDIRVLTNLCIKLKEA